MNKVIDADKLMDIYADRLEKISERFGAGSPEAAVLIGAMELLDKQPDICDWVPVEKGMPEEDLDEIESFNPLKFTGDKNSEEVYVTCLDEKTGRIFVDVAYTHNGKWMCFDNFDNRELSMVEDNPVPDGVKIIAWQNIVIFGCDPNTLGPGSFDRPNPYGYEEKES